MRISKDERLKMKALFGTTEGRKGREEPSPTCPPDTHPCSAAGLSYDQATKFEVSSA